MHTSLRTFQISTYINPSKRPPYHSYASMNLIPFGSNLVVKNKFHKSKNPHTSNYQHVSSIRHAKSKKKLIQNKKAISKRLQRPTMRKERKIQNYVDSKVSYQSNVFQRVKRKKKITSFIHLGSLYLEFHIHPSIKISISKIHLSSIIAPPLKVCANIDIEDISIHSCLNLPTPYLSSNTSFPSLYPSHSILCINYSSMK